MAGCDAAETNTAKENKNMPADLSPLIAEIKVIEDAEDAAIAYINGNATRLQAAVDAALANGATAEQLAPVQAEVDASKAKADAIGAAIVANT